MFAEYVDGSSPRAIASGLNRDRVPSPRGSTWAMTAIRGDLRRGIGILANPIYIGQQVWNRSRWVKHPETGRRVRQERPRSEWVTTEHPDLAIVDVPTWNAAQARMGACGRGGLAVGRGRTPRHLLSGLLKCGECGGPIVVLDRYNYGCSIAKDRGTCSNRVRLKRGPTEERLLAGIRRDILNEEAFQRFQRAAGAALASAAPNTDALRRRLSEAERERDNVMRAIREGVITKTTKAALIAAEAAIEEASSGLERARQFQPAQFLPRAREAWQRITASLADAARDVAAARSAIHDLLGEDLRLVNKNGDLFAEIAASSDAQINVVAGAGFEPATFGL
ncbi:recombinase family protein [Lysobacter arvi]|uniref:recombinase family protein n=1 Tax=Lysobacter arvi TaxID=3038776 RepID=UPI003CCE1C05